MIGGVKTTTCHFPAKKHLRHVKSIMIFCFRMKSPVNMRRLAAGIFLGIALVMLVLGLTLFSQHLNGFRFAFYWLTCFLFTGLAAITALIDMALLRHKLRQEQRELIASTMEEAQLEKARKSSQNK